MPQQIPDGYDAQGNPIYASRSARPTAPSGYDAQGNPITGPPSAVSPVNSRRARTALPLPGVPGGAVGSHPPQPPTSVLPMFGQSSYVGETVKGGLKGIAKTGIGLVQLWDRYQGLLGSRPPMPPEIFDVARARYAHASNPIQETAQAAEQLGEFFVPVGEAAKTATVVGTAVPTLSTRMATSIGRNAAIGADFATRTAAQTGGDPASTLSAGAIGTVIPPAVSGVIRGVAGGINLATNATKTIAKWARQSMTPEGWEAVQATGGNVMPHEISESPLLKFLGNVTAGSPSSQAEYQNFVTNRLKGWIAQAEKWITDVGPRATEEDAGALIKEARKSEQAARYERATQAVQRQGEETIDRAGADRAAAQAAYDAANREVHGTLGSVQTAAGQALGRQPLGTTTLMLLAKAKQAAIKSADDIYNPLWQETAADRLPLTPLLTEAETLGATIGDVPLKAGVAGPGGRAIGILDKAVDAAEGTAGGSVAPNVELLARQQEVRALTKAMDPNDPARVALTQESDRIVKMLQSGVQADGTIALSPQQVHLLRSYYGRMGYASGERNVSTGIWKQLRNAADRTMQQLPKGQLARYRDATGKYEHMINTFERGTLDVIARKATEEVLPTILKQVRAGDVIGITALLGNLSDEGQQAVRGTVWKTVTTSPAGRLLTPKELLGVLDKINLDGLRALYGDTVTAIEGVTPTLRRAASAQAGLSAVEQETGKIPGKVATRLDKLQAGHLQRITAIENTPINDLVAKSLKDADAKGAAKLRTLVMGNAGGGAAGDAAWARVQSVDLQHIFNRYGEAGSREAHLVDPATLRNTLKNRSEEAFTTAHGKPLWNAVQVFQRVYDKLTYGEPGGAGKMLAQLRYPGAISGVVTGTITGVSLLIGSHDLTVSAVGAVASGLTMGGAIVLGPKLLADIFQSPEMRNELLKGMLAKAKGDQTTVSKAMQALTRMLTSAGVTKTSTSPAPPFSPSHATGTPPPQTPITGSRAPMASHTQLGMPPPAAASSSSQISSPTPDLAAKVKRVQERMAAEGYTVVPTSTTRTTSEQQALYAKGRTAPGPRVTNANGTTTPSAHQSGQAEDLAFSVNGKVSWDESLPWALLGKIAKEEGLQWGGDYPSVDRPHVQAGTPPPAAPIKK